MNRDTQEMIDRLRAAGISREDAFALRRIAMTLQRWHELECGAASGQAIERDDATGKPYMTYEAGAGPRRRYPVPDRETGAKTRLSDIMARYPTLTAYIQGDPRGAPLYILRPGDVPDGESADSFYNRGIAVYK